MRSVAATCTLQDISTTSNMPPGTTLILRESKIHCLVSTGEGKGGAPELDPFKGRDFVKSSCHPPGKVSWRRLGGGGQISKASTGARFPMYGL
jgi:hypothetical protein